MSTLKQQRNRALCEAFDRLLKEKGRTWTLLQLYEEAGEMYYISGDRAAKIICNERKTTKKREEPS